MTPSVFNVPVIVWKQPLTATDGTVIGTFKDGAPAVVKKDHGKGRASLATSLVARRQTPKIRPALRSQPTSGAPPKLAPHSLVSSRHHAAARLRESPRSTRQSTTPQTAYRY